MKLHGGGYREADPAQGRPDGCWTSAGQAPGAFGRGPSRDGRPGDGTGAGAGRTGNQRGTGSQRAAGGQRGTGAPANPYPSVGRGTHFLNDAALLGATDEKGWYEANIPFLEVPDQTIQSTYYYRWRVWKEHVRPTGTANGSVLTEFFGYPGYAAPFGAINASSGQQIDEGRWVRDEQPVDDDIQYWLQGAGSGPKPATDEDNSNTTDWAREYSFWLASSVLRQAEVTGDSQAAEALLPELERQYQGWNSQYNAQPGLYWQVPVWDGMEYSASSYETDPADPYHGGAGYRPTINACQYGDATAIAQLAAQAGQRQVAADYTAKAAALKASTQKWLWDPGRQFFYDMGRDNNPDHALLSAREEIGFVPWMFGLPTAADSAAWAGAPAPAGTASDLGVDFGAAVPVTEVRLYTWANTGQGGNVAAPAGYRVQYLGPDGWANVPGQRAAPAAPAANALNVVTFPALTTSQLRVTMTDQPGRCSGVTELEAGGPQQAGARLWIGGPTATTLSLTEGQASTVTTAYWPASSGAGGSGGVTVHLAAPAGWSVKEIHHDGSGTATWSVTPGPGTAPGQQTALYGYATRGTQTVAYGRVSVTVAYSPAAYASQIDDHFSTSDLSGYTQVQSSVTAGTGEVAPQWTAGGGRATATAAQPWFGFLVSPTAPASPAATAVVDVKALDSGAVNHSSGVFVGLVRDPDNYIMVWYNSYYHSSGEDLVLNGVLQPPGFPVACCADVTLQPGDRFAFALDGNTVTSYDQPGGSGPWTELESTSVAPLLDLTDPATLAQYHFAFGLRGDSGTMAVSRFWAGSAPAASFPARRAGG